MKTSSYARSVAWALFKLAPALAIIVLVSSSRTADYQFAAERLLSKDNHYGYINYDERAFQSIIARRLQTPVTVLVAGSSRTMQLDSNCFDGLSYNASVSGAMISDIAAIIEQFRRGRHLKQVVIAADPWMLNGFAQSEAWDGARIAPNLERMQAAPDWIRVQLRLGLMPSWRDFMAAARAELNPIRGMLAPASFHAALTIRAEFAPASHLYRKQPDGGLTMPESVLNLPNAQVTQAALNMADLHLEKLYTGFRTIDPFLAKAFAAITTDLKINGIRVTLVLAPFHPLYYERVIHSDGGGLLPEAEAYFRRLGNDVIGSYDPAEAGAVAADFFDGVHMKRNPLQHLYGCRETR